MDSKRMKLLERDYETELNAAIRGQGVYLMQTKAALAKTMVEEGYLTYGKQEVCGVIVEGYELTHFGRMAYCFSCEDGES